jgi:hypothetical protein
VESISTVAKFFTYSASLPAGGVPDGYTVPSQSSLDQPEVPRYNLSSGGEISPASSTKSRCCWGSSI